MQICGIFWSVSVNTFYFEKIYYCPLVDSENIMTIIFQENLQYILRVTTNSLNSVFMLIKPFSNT